MWQQIRYGKLLGNAINRDDGVWGKISYPLATGTTGSTPTEGSVWRCINAGNRNMSNRAGTGGHSSSQG